VLDVVDAVRPVGDELAVQHVLDVYLGLADRVDGVLQLVVGQLPAQVPFDFPLQVLGSCQLAVFLQALVVERQVGYLFDVGRR
jgi:hypothetical protein